MNIAEFSGTNGNIASNTPLTLTQTFNNDTDGDITRSTTGNSITLMPGNYLIEYNATTTGSTETQALAFYLNDTQIPQTLAQATPQATSDLSNLSAKHVINVTSTQTLELRNASATPFTVNNLNILVTKL